MCKSPVFDEASSNTRPDRASQDLTIECEGRLLALMLCVKVRKTMFAVKHTDHNAEEG